jgi:hydrogenase nickel incorporation protein HypB
MCGTCGCAKPLLSAHAPVARIKLDVGFEARRAQLEHAVVDKNDRLAAQNRKAFRAASLLTINFMSSPGSGKTTLLERTIERLLRRAAAPIFVIQGDQATDRDAERVRRAGAKAVQINTGQGCHLDASMIERAVAELGLGDGSRKLENAANRPASAVELSSFREPSPNPAEFGPQHGSLLAIENVGNLVCPAMFDLGERYRVAVISVTEGDDKPLKYPHMFKKCDLVLINKLDLLEHCDFDLEACCKNILAMNPRAEILVLSARRGDGMQAWIDWLTDKLLRTAEPVQRSTP